MAERGKLRSATETRFLIDTWSQDSIQKQLHSAKRNDNVFAQIVSTLAKHGYYKTAQQCHAKKGSKKKYKAIADRLRKSREGRESDKDDISADFPFFDNIDAVMGGRASVSPVHLLDSFETTQPELEEGDVTHTISSSRPSTPQLTSRPDTPAPLPGWVELDTLPSTPVTSVPDTPASKIPHSPGSGTARDIPGSGTARDIPGSSSSKTPMDIPGP